MEDGSDLEAEGLICLPGQIDIRSYMLPTKPIMDFTADEEVAREMGLDFSLEEDSEDRGFQAWEDIEMIGDEKVESFEADEEAAAAMGLNTSLDPMVDVPPAAAPTSAPRDAGTPARPKRKAQIVLEDTPEKKIRISNTLLEAVADKMEKPVKHDILENMDRPAEVLEVL